MRFGPDDPPGGGRGAADPGVGDVPRFQPLRSATFAAVEAGDYAQSVAISLDAGTRFPAHGEIPIWIACGFCRLGEPEAALAALRAGLARGHFWPDAWLLEDDDLALLRGRPELAAIVLESAAARSVAARERSRGDDLEPVVLTAAGMRGATAAPRTVAAPCTVVAQGAADAPGAVAIALHGWGQDADEFALHWRAVAEAGLTVVVPRSSQELTPGFHVWDDRTTARAEIAAQVRATRDALRLGKRPGRADPPERASGAATRQLVLAGFSQGGGLAVDLAIDAEPAPAAGVLAVAAGVEDLVEPPGPDRLAPAVANGLRGRLLVGDCDEALEGARALSRAAAAAGLSWQLTVRPGAGHEMPDPPGEALAAEIAALLA